MRDGAMSEERKAGERLLFKCVMLLAGILLAFWLVPIIWDKLSPFILSIPLAAMLQPLLRFCEQKLKMKRTVASVILVILMLAVGIAMLIFFLNFAIDQVTDLVNHSGDIVKDTVAAIRNLTNSILESAVNISTELGPVLAQELLTWLVNLAASTPYMVIYTSFLAMALYFVSKDYEGIRAYLPGGKRHRQDSTSTQLTNSAVKNLTAYLKVQGVFGLMVLVVSWPYLALFHYPYAAVLSMAAGIMELIPMIGSGFLYLVLSVVYFLNGETAVGWQLLGLTLGLQTLRRLVEPKIVSNVMSISPLQGLIGMFVGMKVGGVIRSWSAQSAAGSLRE